MESINWPFLLVFPRSFELVTLDGTYLMVVKDAEEKETWIKSVEEAIEANLNKTDNKGTTPTNPVQQLTPHP